MKKILIKFLVGILTMVFLTNVIACSKKQENMKTETGTKNTTKETVTFKFFRNLKVTEYPADGGEGKKLILDFAAKQGVTGVDFQVEMASGTEYEPKLNLLIASGNPPDYFDATIDKIAKFAESGVIMPLDNLVKLMPNAQGYWLKDDLDVLKLDGKLYGFPNGFRSEPINQPQAAGFVLRQDWLDNLDLKTPQTLEEFYRVIKAFTLNDPDKNGKNDTFGLGSIKAKDYSPYFDGIFGAYGVMPGFWFERNGQLKLGSTLPETKEVLTVLNKWYKEKLIDPEFMIIEKKQLDEKLINSKVGITTASVWDINPDQVLYQSLKKAAPTAKLTLLAPPKGPGGQQGWSQVAPGNGSYAMSAKCQNPELLAKFLDTTVGKTENDGPGISAGFEGKDFTFDKATNVIKYLLTTNESWKRGLSHPIQFINVVDRRWVYEDEMKKGLEIANKYVTKSSFWKIVPARSTYPDLGKLWNEYFIKIVVGDLPVSAWDEYVDKFYKQGGQELENQVNEEWKKSKK